MIAHFPKGPLKPLPANSFSWIVDLAKLPKCSKVYVFVAGSPACLGYVMPVDKNKVRWIAMDDREQSVEGSREHTRNEAIASLIRHWLKNRVKETGLTRW